MSELKELRNVRVQVIDPKTGEVLESVNTKTSAGAVLLANGTTLQNWMDLSESEHSEFQLKLAEHLAQAHIDPSKLNGLLAGKPTYDETTGELIFTDYTGNELKIETALSKVVTNWTVVEGDGSEGGGEVGKIYLKLLFEEDSAPAQLVDLSKLIDTYYGFDPGEGNAGLKTEMFADSEDGNKVKIKVTINPGTITKEMLAKELADEIEQVATNETAGKVIIGDGLSVDEDGRISASAVTREGEVISLNFVPEENNVEITVDAPAQTLVVTTVGTGVSAIAVTAAASGDKAADATLTYQWYKKTLGTDVAFVAIDGATDATLAADSIGVTEAGSTMYYCVVGATGEGIVADAVQSRKVTVTVNAAE
ncbi:MAG: hypothetical protein NC548_41445 [Lachnospiraceae bacterium]|nr:hypothetical protein [Lachnospiraceae bacterium]